MYWAFYLCTIAAPLRVRKLRFGVPVHLALKKGKGVRRKERVLLTHMCVSMIFLSSCQLVDGLMFANWRKVHLIFEAMVRMVHCFVSILIFSFLSRGVLSIVPPTCST